MVSGALAELPMALTKQSWGPWFSQLSHEKHRQHLVSPGSGVQSPHTLALRAISVATILHGVGISAHKFSSLEKPATFCDESHVR